MWSLMRKPCVIWKWIMAMKHAEQLKGAGHSSGLTLTSYIFHKWNTAFFPPCSNSTARLFSFICSMLWQKKKKVWRIEGEHVDTSIFVWKGFDFSQRFEHGCDGSDILTSHMVWSNTVWNVRDAVRIFGNQRQQFHQVTHQCSS